MSIREWLNRARLLFGRDQSTAELEDEMRMHIEMRAEKLRAEGMSDADASSEARRRFGNVGATVETSRDAWGFGSFDQWKQDVRHAFRRLRQRPTLSVPVIAALALGIGATSAVFSAVDAAMLRDLPFPRAHELYTLSNVDIPLDAGGQFEPGRWVRINNVAGMAEHFSHVGAYASGGLNLSDPDRPQRVNAGVVTGTLFGTLGIRPVYGRTFSAEESRPNGPLVTVLSYNFWRRQYGGAEMIGKHIILHGKSYEVIGIMPQGFSFPSSSDLWIPLPVPMTFATFEPFRGWLPSSVIGRVKTGVSAEQASAALLSRWEQVASESGPGSSLEETVKKLRAVGTMRPLQRELLGNRRTAMLVLMGATACLLLIACANVANLLLSDGAKRRREIAVREVLGATRKRVARQLLVESTMLAVAGAAAGLVLAPVALRVLRATLPGPLEAVSPAQLDLRILAFALALAIVTSLLFGLWPAFAATRGDAATAIKAGGGHGATAGGMGRVRASLVVFETALTVVLLVGAGLMLRSFARLMGEDAGFDPEQVATLELSFPRSVQNAEKQRVLFATLERLKSQPGVAAAGAVNDLPLRGGGGISVTIDVPGGQRRSGEIPMARTLSASGDYFAAMGIRVLRGRTFNASDANGPTVIVISANVAERYWPGQDPVGKYLTWRGDTARMHIIGVVSDVREIGLESDPRPALYQSMERAIPFNIAIVARGTLPPSIFLTRMNEAMRAADASQAVYNVRMMDQVVRTSVAPRRTNTILIVVFAALALVLSALGVYAVLAYGVAQRMREFGIRSALGATGADLMGLVSREMGVLVAAGLVIGLASAWALGRVMQSMLYEVEPRDPATFVVVPLVLLLPALLATLVPALRAVRVSPTTVMREE